MGPNIPIGLVQWPRALWALKAIGLKANTISFIPQIKVTSPIGPQHGLQGLWPWAMGPNMPFRLN